MVIFCDIDNTILKTEDHLTNGLYSISRFTKLGIGRKWPVIDFVKNAVDEDDMLCFISHRRKIFYLSTFVDLRLMGFSKFKLILVRNPEMKIKYLSKYYGKIKLYIDDLSYDAEKGERKFYNNIIDYCRINSINYYDWKFIEGLCQE